MGNLVLISSGVGIGILMALVIVKVLRRERQTEEREPAIKLEADVRALVHVTKDGVTGDDIDIMFGKRTDTDEGGGEESGDSS